jgi:hypothetical protein
MPEPSHIEQLLTDIKDSLERDITNLGKRMEERFDQIGDRFDVQSVRLEARREKGGSSQ